VGRGGKEKDEKITRLSWGKGNTLRLQTRRVQIFITKKGHEAAHDNYQNRGSLAVSLSDEEDSGEMVKGTGGDVNSIGGKVLMGSKKNRANFQFKVVRGG